MGRLAAYDSQALTDLLRRQDGLIARAQAADCALTAPALRHRIRPGENVDVLTPPNSRRRDVGFARLHPTAFTPTVAYRDGDLVYAPLARAIADTVRQLRMARHARMSAHGIIVLHYPPSRVRQAGHEVAGEIRSALAVGRDRPLPLVRALPAS